MASVIVVLLTTVTTRPVPVTIWLPLAKTSVIWPAPLGTNPVPLITTFTTSVALTSTGVAAGYKVVRVATAGVTVSEKDNAMLEGVELGQLMVTVAVRTSPATALA